MTTFLFKNNAISTLAGPISAVATTINVASGSGVLFPSPSGGQVFALTLVSASNPTALEIVYCTAVTGDALTVVRGREGTTAQPFLAGDFADHRLTAGALSTLVQSGSGFYYAQDTGTWNALAISVPAISALAAGMVFVIKKSSVANTGACTLSVNGGSAIALVNADGTALTDIAGLSDWPANATGIVEYDGTQFNLLSTMGPTVYAKNVILANRDFTTSSVVSQTLPNNTVTQYINFTTGSASFGSMSASAFTVSVAGVYAISGAISTTLIFTGVGNIAVSTTIYKNGVAVPNGSTQVGNYGSSPESANCLVSRVLTLAAADVISIWGFGQSSAPTSAAMTSATLSITRLF